VLAIRANSNGARTMQGNVTMGDLAGYLTGTLGRPVFDRTDLKGTYEVALSYFEEDLARSVDAAAHPDPNTPIATIFQAVQQTLGLKLEATKAPLAVIVVDSGNKVPTQN
jgi:uncharacterized protein (TIGR03435 family)